MGNFIFVAHMLKDCLINGKRYSLFSLCMSFPCLCLKGAQSLCLLFIEYLLFQVLSSFRSFLLKCLFFLRDNQDNDRWIFWCYSKWKLLGKYQNLIINSFLSNQILFKGRINKTDCLGLVFMVHLKMLQISFWQGFQFHYWFII